MQPGVIIDQTTYLYFTSAILQVFGAILFGGLVFWVIRNEREGTRLEERRRFLATEIVKAQGWAKIAKMSPSEKRDYQLKVLTNRQLEEAVTERLAHCDSAMLLWSAVFVMKGLKQLEEGPKKTKQIEEDTARIAKFRLRVAEATHHCRETCLHIVWLRKAAMWDIIILSGVMLYLGVLIAMANATGKEHIGLLLQAAIVSLVGLIVTILFAWGMTDAVDVSNSKGLLHVPDAQIEECVRECFDREITTEKVVEGIEAFDESWHA